MNAFVLCTGRCGSTTITVALQHATNWTAGHETEGNSYYPLAYPDQHIEADNRLSWMLGPLAERFPDARYIHLIRDQEAVAASFARRRYHLASSISGFGQGILGRGELFQSSRYATACRMWEIVNANIRVFLQGRPSECVFPGPVRLEELTETFPLVWEWLGCEGDREGATAECGVRYNT